MISYLIRKKINDFEQEFDYNMDYARHMAAVSTKALMLFGRVSKLAELRIGVPEEVFCAVKLVATQFEDCGPCTQLGVTMAERKGIAPERLRAILTRDYAQLPADVALAIRFADAVLARSPEADTLRESLVERFGDVGVVSIALGMAASRMFPTIKYALGFGKACATINVGNQMVPGRLNLA